MKTLALFLACLLLPFAATPQTYGNSAQVIASGFTTIGAGNGFLGFKVGISACNGFNDTFGTYTTTQGSNAASMFGISTLRCMMSLTSTYDLKIGIDNNSLTQNFFSYVRIVDCAGSVRIYTSASATFSNGNPSKVWTWGTGSSVVMASPCAGAPLQVIFFR